MSRAELAHSEGDFEDALSLASQSLEGLDDFVTDANVLRFEALQQSNFDFLIFVVGTVVGLIVVVGGAFAVWFILKRRFAYSGGVSA